MPTAPDQEKGTGSPIDSTRGGALHNQAGKGHGRGGVRKKWRREEMLVPTLARNNSEELEKRLAVEI